MAFMNGPRKDSKVLYNNAYNSPKFSDLTTSAANNNNKKITVSGIQKKIIKKKVQDENKAGDFKVNLSVLLMIIKT